VVSNTRGAAVLAADACADAGLQIASLAGNTQQALRHILGPDSLVAGPVALQTPPGVDRVDVETAEEMAEAVFAALPADAAILVAAVADWRVRPSSNKLKKSEGPPRLEFIPTRDILAELAASDRRPRLLVGFAAETENVVEQAIAKRISKGPDWIVANDVSGDVMGGHRNHVHLITEKGVEHWPEAAKDEVARQLVERVARELG